MHVNCICCGHRFDLGRSYDDYDGLVRCPICRGLLDIRSESGNLKRVRPGRLEPIAEAPTAGRITPSQEPRTEAA